GQVEREVVERFEEAINGIPGVTQINSTSSDAFAQIIVQFVFSKTPDQASQEIRDAISGIRDRLPPEMKEPIIRKFDPADLPIVSLVLQSTTLDPAEMTLLADPGVTKELRAISGVAQVSVVGGVAREVAVKLDPAALRAHGVSVSQVVGALQSQNLASPVGRVNAEFEEQTIRLQGRIQNVDEFRQLVVSSQGSQLVRLDDVADVADTSAEARSLGIFNGVDGIGIDVTKSKGVSTAAVADKVKEAVGEIEKRLPAGTKIAVVKDAGARVEASVRNVQEALIEGAFLTVIVVFLFLNSWRSTVITGLALPVSTIAAFIAVQAFGFTLNTMSLLGLSLAIGILIDDAIVVRENIVRHIEMGQDHLTASRRGTAEIGLAVAATTFSIIAVFVPIGFMDGIAGQWFKPFALTIACAVLVSLFVSFSLDPMLSAYWPDPEIEEGQHRHPIARVLVRFNNWFDRQAERYRHVIAWALDHRWSMIALAVFTFVGAIMLQAMFGGGGFAPVSDRSEITVNVETPPGSSLAYTRLKAEEIATIVRSHKEVAYTYSSIGSATGSGAVDIGTIYARLIPKADRALSQEGLEAIIRGEIRRVGGVITSVATGGFGDNMKQIAIEVRGDDEVQMNAAADLIAAGMAKVNGAVDIGLSTRGQKPEIEIELNRALIGSMGITVGQVAQSLYPAFAGLDVGDWVDPSGRTRDVVVRLEATARQNVADLAALPLVLAPGGFGAPGGGGGSSGASVVPLGQIATVRQAVGPASIDHLDRDRVIIVGANVEGRSLSEVSEDITKGLDGLDIPPGVRVTQGGEVKEQAEVFTNILSALGLAILLMYLILVVQFGSFLDPLAIMLSLPLSLIGVVLALLITGDTLNIMSMIGVILLMGIVAKNAILLIDFAKHAKKEKGLSTRDALIEAGRVRLRPIMMTTLALIAGMIPVAIGAGEGADFRAPLGRAVIGGTITSTLLTLLVVPTIYEIFDEWRAWFRRKLHRKLPDTGAAGEAAVARSDQ
ncbi:MAG: efflux RND transporter permease subunit, partial [bacterium]|nr:efflux RND transporter permease subunit [Candidatus Kapabacteria bacterium]